MSGREPARRIAAVIDRVASQVSILDGAGGVFRASIQPVRGLAGEKSGPWGVEKRRRATIYAPWGETVAKLKEGVRLGWQGDAYRLIGVETLRVGDFPLYIWGLLEREGEEKPWI